MSTTTQQESRGGAQSTPQRKNKGLQGTGGGSQQGGKEARNEEEDGTNAEDEAAVSKPKSMAPPAKPTQTVAGPKAGHGQQDDLTDAVSKKMSELEASGWRPEEEVGEDDDDYNDVDLISETDDDDKNMRQLEERSMRIDDIVPATPEEDNALARRLSLISDGSDLVDDTFDWHADLDLSNMPSMSMILEDLDFMESGTEMDNSLFTPLDAKIESDSTSTGRRVRFEDELDGSDAGSDDTEHVAEIFPDLFMQADELGPNLQLMVDDDVYLDDGSDAGSCWDFEGEDMQVDLDDDDASSESVGSSSGYETDEGETTEEEELPPPSVTRKLAEERRSRAESTSTAMDTPKSARPNASGTKRKSGARRASSPRLPTPGTFILDPHRPVLLVDGAGNSQRNTYYPARIQTPSDRAFWRKLSKALWKSNATRTRVQLSPGDNEDDEEMIQGLLTGNDGLSIFDSAGRLLTEQIVGPANAFMPFTDIDAGGFVTEENSQQSLSDDGEQGFLDLVNFDSDDDEDEDEEMPDESDATDANYNSASPFPYLKSDSRGSDLLAHLDRNKALVGSFRRNQHIAKQVGSMASHPGLRASTSEVNAMQTGRRAAANTPITPLRKKRIGKNVGSRSSPMLSPPIKSTARKNKGPARGGFGRR